MVFLAREGGGDMEARKDCGGVVCLVRDSYRTDSGLKSSGSEEEGRMVGNERWRERPAGYHAPIFVDEEM